MSDPELDRLLSSSPPDTGASDLADRVVARLIAERERRARFRVGLTTAGVVVVLGLFSMTRVGETVGDALMTNPVAEALGVALAATLFSFAALQWIEDWVSLK